MSFKDYTREEITEIVDSHLQELVGDDDIRFHMTEGFLTSLFEKKKMFPVLYTKRADSQIVHHMFLRGDYETLVRWGDSLMLICGMFPEWTSKKRHASLGMGYWVGVGVSCYQQAINAKNEGRAKVVGADPKLINYLSDHFPEHSGIYFRLREEMGDTSTIDYEVARELKHVFGVEPKYASNIIRVIGPAKGNKPGLSAIPGGQILDAEDLNYVPIDRLVEIALENAREIDSPVTEINSKEKDYKGDYKGLSVVKGEGTPETQHNKGGAGKTQLRLIKNN